MKFNINLNQKKMIEHNLNVHQWCILDVISSASNWCEIIQKDGTNYFWVARNKIADELQALGLKADTIYRHIKNLHKLGFLIHTKHGKKDLIILTNLGKSLFFTMSEINQNHYVGNKSEFAMSEINPIDNNTYYNKTDNKTEEFLYNHQIYIDMSNEEKELFLEYISIRKKMKIQNTNKIIDRLLEKFVQYGRSKEVIEKAIMSNWKDFYPIKETKHINKPITSNGFKIKA